MLDGKWKVEVHASPEKVSEFPIRGGNFPAASATPSINEMDNSDCVVCSFLVKFLSIDVRDK